MEEGNYGTTNVSGNDLFFQQNDDNMADGNYVQATGLVNTYSIPKDSTPNQADLSQYKWKKPIQEFYDENPDLKPPDDKNPIDLSKLKLLGKGNYGLVYELDDHHVIKTCKLDADISSSLDSSIKYKAIKDTWFGLLKEGYLHKGIQDKIEEKLKQEREELDDGESEQFEMHNIQRINSFAKTSYGTSKYQHRNTSGKRRSRKGRVMKSPVPDGDDNSLAESDELLNDNSDGELNINKNIAQIVSLKKCIVNPQSSRFPTIGLVCRKYDTDLLNVVKALHRSQKMTVEMACDIMLDLIEGVITLHETCHCLHNDIAIRNFLVIMQNPSMDHPVISGKKFLEVTDLHFFSNLLKGKLEFVCLVADFGLSVKLSRSTKSKAKVDGPYSTLAANSIKMDNKMIEYYGTSVNENPQHQPFWWCSPEILENMIDHAPLKYSKATDYYMLGVTFAEIIIKSTRDLGYLPFEYQPSSDDKYVTDITKSANKFTACYHFKKEGYLDIRKNLGPDCSVISPEFLDFHKVIKQLTNPDPKKRPDNLETIREDLKKIKNDAIWKRVRGYIVKTISIIAILIFVLAVGGIVTRIVRKRLSCEPGKHRDENGHCAWNVCICPNGKPYTHLNYVKKFNLKLGEPDEYNNYCWANGSKSCIENSCEPGYKSTKHKYNKPDHEDWYECDDCLDFYHKDESGDKCVENQCSCENGVAVSNSECLVNNKEQCDKNKCYKNHYYDFDSKSCLKNQCQCHFGKPSDNCLSPNDESCDPNFCDSGYHPEEIGRNVYTCEFNECSCSNGRGATGTDCPVHGEERCEICDDSHFLTIPVSAASKRNPKKRDITTQPANICQEKRCTCLNGQPNTGSACYENLKESCAINSCNEEFQQSTVEVDGEIVVICNKCKEQYTPTDSKPDPRIGNAIFDESCVLTYQKCKCSNGVARKISKCTAEYPEWCEKCRRGYKRESVDNPEFKNQRKCEWSINFIG